MKKKMLALEEDKIYLLLKVVMFLLDKDSRECNGFHNWNITTNPIGNLHLYFGAFSIRFCWKQLTVAHAYTDVGGCNAMCWPAHQEQFWVQYLAQGHFNMQTREIKPVTRKASYYSLNTKSNMLLLNTDANNIWDKIHWVVGWCMCQASKNSPFQSGTAFQ